MLGQYGMRQMGSDGDDDDKSERDDAAKMQKK
jgi:hypothetical protein